MERDHDLEQERKLKILVGLGLALLLACEPGPGSSFGDAGEAGSGLAGDGAAPVTASGLVGIDATAFCSRLINECQQAILDMTTCVRTYGALRVTPTCRAALASGTCAELNSSTSRITQICFPPCNGVLANCNADGTISLCNADGTTRVADCQATCAADGRTWTKTCGMSFEGQISASPQCWCK
jgi:hypothetical protein